MLVRVSSSMSRHCLGRCQVEPDLRTQVYQAGDLAAARRAFDAAKEAMAHVYAWEGRVRAGRTGFELEGVAIEGTGDLDVAQRGRIGARRQAR